MSEFPSFLRLTIILLFGNVTFCSSSHQSLRHLGCFHVLSVVNTASVNMGGQISESLLSVLLDIYLGVGLLSYMVFTCGYGVHRTNTGSKGC